MILGLICGLGTTKLATLSFALIIICLVFQRKRVVVPWELWTIVGILELTELWSIQPGKATYESCAILCAWLSWKVLPRKGFAWGISIIALTQVAWISYQYIEGISRPWGLSRNASVVGLSGMWGLPLLSMSILGGMSLSRTAIVGSLVLATRSRIHALSAIILIVLSLGIGLIITPDRYFSLHEISEDAQLRIDAANGTDSRTLDIPLQEVHWLPYGYGFGQYYFRTGHIQPHNIIIRTWYELGLFSIPVFSILLWLWWKWGKDWRFLACALVTGMLTDELLGYPQGIYMVLTYAILTTSAQQGINRLGFADTWRSWSSAAISRTHSFIWS